MSGNLLATARAWRDQDPDPETRAEIDALLAAAESGDTPALVALHDRFDTRLAFGTAGLRGAIEAGSNRMNRVLVSQAAVGLAEFLLARAGAGERPTVVIGYDGRKNSRVFAEDSAALIAGAGASAILLPRLLPTPVLAFAVRYFAADAGVMVTASHNPPNDNGYKVYLGGPDQGAQIVSPVDGEIAARILTVAESRRVPELPRGDYDVADDAVVEAYIAATATVGRPFAPLSSVYTAMHGVGWETARRVYEAAGFDLPDVVDAQIAPDPAFPTVAFPNPEEKGALDLAFEAARAHGSELIIANDPDADRLAIAIPDAAEDSGYRRLTGNEVGALLGWRAAELAAFRAGGGAATGTLACSIVSSPALGAVASAYGLDWVETLTGFKWISRVPGLIFGYEEALGYLVNPATVRDKDGISASVAFLSLAGWLRSEGRTVADHLDAFSARFGHYASDQISIRVTDLSRIGAIMARLRAKLPFEVGGLAVTRVDDLFGGFGELAGTDALRFHFDGARMIVRPSGTEPKLKIYLDTWSGTGSLEERKAESGARLEALRAGVAGLIGE